MPSALPTPQNCCNCDAGFVLDTDWLNNYILSQVGTSSGVEVRQVDLVSSIQSVSVDDNLKLVVARGLAAVNDGLGGLWAYLSSNADAADGYQIIAPLVGSGRFHKVL